MTSPDRIERRAEPPEAIDAFLGAFGLATSVVWIGHLPLLDGPAAPVLTGAGWITAAITMGWAFGERWKSVCLGLAASVAVVVIIDALHIRPLPGEWSAFDRFFWWVSMGAVAAFGILPVVIGTLAHDGRTSPAIARVARRIGLAAAIAAGVTLATFWLSPATRSFSVPLDPRWYVMPPGAPFGTATYGHQLTAVYGSATLPPRGQSQSKWPIDPVVGVSVTRGNGVPANCHRAFDRWPGELSPLYQEAPAEVGTLSLRAGPAHRVVHAEDDGSRMVSYAITRERYVGAVIEPICYLLVITMPAGSGLTERDADQIAEDFAFR